MILKKSKLDIHSKAWGTEMWIHNGDGYCGKILKFNKGAKFSLHAHFKVETWLVRGKFKLIYINTDNADKYEIDLNYDDVIHIPSLLPHQLIALEEGEIIEVSQIHDENGSFRYEKGDSQTNNT